MPNEPLSKASSHDGVSDETSHIAMGSGNVSFASDMSGGDRRRVGQRNAFNQVGIYLQQLANVPLLTKDEEQLWFRVIDASSEKVREIFARFLFAAEMVVSELRRLESGDLYFDSIVSGCSNMRCATYKQQIPDLCRDIAHAADRLAGAAALYQALGDTALEELVQARDNMQHHLRKLSLRQSVIEALCDAAYEDIYKPYMDCRDRRDRRDRRDQRERRERRERRNNDASSDLDSRIADFEAMFGMAPNDFMDSFNEMRNVLQVIQAARTKIVESNMRLVVHVAKKYVNRGIELSDLLQDGSIGLMAAVHKFDWRRGHKFSTYAAWWIRQAISRSLANNSRTIRVPSHMVDMLSKMNTVEKTLMQQLGREPRTSEIARRMKTTPERICQLRDLRQQVVSLDSAVSDDNDTTIGELTSDTKSESSFEQVERHMLCESVRQALSALTEREQMVMSMRYGLSDGVPRNLDEIGRVFNVTREHIRKLERGALDKLRQSNQLKMLAELAMG